MCIIRRKGGQQWHKGKEEQLENQSPTKQRCWIWGAPSFCLLDQRSPKWGAPTHDSVKDDLNRCRKKIFRTTLSSYFCLKNKKLIFHIHMDSVVLIRLHLRQPNVRNGVSWRKRASSKIQRGWQRPPPSYICFQHIEKYCTLCMLGEADIWTKLLN